MKVLSAKLSTPIAWGTRKDGSHVLSFPVTLTLKCERNGKKLGVSAVFSEGFRCDGLSVPVAFRWFLKSWDSKNMLYNFAGAFHDWLYATKGNGCKFSREECDDIFRGILRESGIGRFKAGLADKAVELFAGGKEHWGEDNYKVAGLVAAGVSVA